MSKPAHTALSIQPVLTENSMTPFPTLPVHPILPNATFFLFPQWKKVLKGKHFVHVEKVKQKMAKALKGIKIDKFKNFFDQWKNVLIGVLHQKESTWRWRKFKYVRINTQF